MTVNRDDILISWDSRDGAWVARRPLTRGEKSGLQGIGWRETIALKELIIAENAMEV